MVYLEKPNKEIIFDQGENDKIKFLAAGMQGWRINMVSRHITFPRIPSWLVPRPWVVESSDRTSALYIDATDWRCDHIQ